MSWSKLHKETLTTSCTEWSKVKAKKTERKDFLDKMVTTIEAEQKDKYPSQPPLTNLLKVFPSLYHPLYNMAYMLYRKSQLGIKTMSRGRR
jgi:high-affinity K+ transport system ATPase subunit B